VGAGVGHDLRGLQIGLPFQHDGQQDQAAAQRARHGDRVQPRALLGQQVVPTDAAPAMEVFRVCCGGDVTDRHDETHAVGLDPSCAPARCGSLLRPARHCRHSTCRRTHSSVRPTSACRACVPACPAAPAAPGRCCRLRLSAPRTAGGQIDRACRALGSGTRIHPCSRCARQKRTIEHVENFYLEDYDAKRWPTGDYELKVPNDTDEDLDEAASELLSDIAYDADNRHCFSECAARMERTDRHW